MADGVFMENNFSLKIDFTICLPEGKIQVDIVTCRGDVGIDTYAKRFHGVKKNTEF